jgi:uncharacterized protein (TIGR02147 family)
VYQAAKDHLAQYSYTQFAQDLGFSASNVIWLVITGRRRLTPTATNRIIVALGLKSGERRYFLTLVKYTNARRPEQRERLFDELVRIKGEALASSSQEQLEYFSQWYHPVLRELAGLESFQSDPTWIAAQLHFSLLPRQITKSLELLEKLGLIRYDEARGRHIQQSSQVQPDRAVGVMAAIGFHQAMIEMARESITRVPEERRDLNALTVCVSRDGAAKIRAHLQKVCEDILAIEKESSPGEDVYQINLQLFPFTKEAAGERNKS